MLRRFLCWLGHHELEWVNCEAPVLQSHFKWSRVSFDCMVCKWCDQNPTAQDEEYRLLLFMYNHCRRVKV